MAFAIGVPYSNGRGSGKGVILASNRGAEDEEEPPDSSPRIYLGLGQRVVAVTLGQKINLEGQFFTDGHQIPDYISGRPPNGYIRLLNKGLNFLVAGTDERNKNHLYTVNPKGFVAEVYNPYLISLETIESFPEIKFRNSDEAKKYAISQLKKRVPLSIVDLITFGDACEILRINYITQSFQSLIPNHRTLDYHSTRQGQSKSQ